MSNTKKGKITDLEFDDKNFNLGSEYGAKLLDNSFTKFGAGRSVLVDKNNRLIAGNKSAEMFGQLGNENIIIVETTGDELVVVKRTDIDLDSQQGREMALADNQVSKINFVLAEEVLAETLTAEVCEAWGVKQFQVLDEGFGTEFSLKDGDKAPFQQMTFTLADEQAIQVQNAISDIKLTQEYKYAETMGNENSNGNALYLIIMQWAEQKK